MAETPVMESVPLTPKGRRTRERIIHAAADLVYDAGVATVSLDGVPIVAGDTLAMRDWAEQLVARARSEGVELTGDEGLLTAMVRSVLQTGLEVELADYLGYEPYDPAGRGSGNSRNGSTPKTVTTEIRDVELRIPRDRNGTFDPQTIPKHQRRLDGLTRETSSAADIGSSG